MVKDIRCPFCKSDRVSKSGFTYWVAEKRQRYYCWDCHKSTVKPIKISNEADIHKV